MKIKIILILLLTLLILGCKHYDIEEIEQARFEKMRAQGIKIPKIVGNAEILTEPDYAMIYMRAGGGGSTPLEAERRGAERTNMAKDRFIEAGLKESNINIEFVNPSWDPGTNRFVATPLLSARVDDMENLRTYLNSVVSMFAEVRIVFELSDRTESEVSKEVIKLAKENAKAQGATTMELLFADKNIDVEEGIIRKYPEIAYAYSLEKTIEEAENVDLTPKPAKVKATVAVLEKLSWEEFEARMNNTNS
ncbi:SIMPL domain-containing protein [Candidatus Woesearchaeota archaeon]|nr:SIMPL domain-containing protein [Candidatus Woesearchaeota archaeon]